jgi:signal transduction histidine kinase
MLIDLLDKETISKEDLPIYSADVRHQLTQSGQILDNLLNWAKTELNLSPANGNLRSNPYTVGEEVIKELAFVSSKKNIVIKNEIPPALMLKVPADILRIVTRNLLSNALFM